MAKRLPNSVYRAINREMTPSFNRWAKKNYGMTGKRLIAKVYAGEGGGSIDEGTAKRSSAGAWGPGQFIPDTRNAYIKQYKVDPWKNDRSAVRGTMIHLKGTGVAGYNPGMPTYESYILGQNVDTRPLRTGQNRATVERGATTSSRRVQGLDLSAERQALQLDYLEHRGQPGALLGLAEGLKGAQDIAGGRVTSLAGQPGTGTRSGPSVKAGNGVTVHSLLSTAVKFDKAKAPYQLGGGHGSIGKPGERVDCSGYVSAILNLKTPMVSGQLATWGKPGKGKWITVYANDGHTFMSIRDPKTRKVRWFGTSKSNPGGGAGEISRPPDSYLSQFAVRHPG